MGSGRIKSCLKCNREYPELMNYCSKCGIQVYDTAKMEGCITERWIHGKSP